MRRTKGVPRNHEGRSGREAAIRRLPATDCEQAVLPAALPFVFAILWASSYAAAKIGLADITPYAFVALRLAIAAGAAVVMVLALRRSWQPIARRWPHLLVSGALAHGLALATAHKALVSVAATPTALVHAFHPLLTAALGVFLLGETFRWWQWVGFTLGLAGVVLGVPHDADFTVLALLGLSLFGLSGGTLYLKRFAADVPPFEATAAQLIGGHDGVLRDAARSAHAGTGRRDDLERAVHVDRRDGDLQPDDGPRRRRQGGVRILHRARRFRTDRLGAARRAASHPGAGRARGRDGRRRAGVVAESSE
jgi:uncharacterized membrane protein